MKILRLISVFALLFVVAGCTKDSLTPVGNNDVVISRDKKYVTKPMEMYLEGIEDVEAGQKPCTPQGVPASVPRSGWMQGHGTHLGTLNMSESPFEHGDCELIFNDAGQPVKIMIRHSHGYWTGASGDQLEWDGTFEVFFDGTFFVDLDIVDGTGKFEDATGNVKGWGEPLKTGFPGGVVTGHINIPK